MNWISEVEDVEDVACPDDDMKSHGQVIDAGSCMRDYKNKTLSRKKISQLSLRATDVIVNPNPIDPSDCRRVYCRFRQSCHQKSNKFKAHPLQKSKLIR